MMTIFSNNLVFREFVHWMWLWVLAAVVVGVLQSRASGAGQTDRLFVPSIVTESENVTLDDVLVLNEGNDYERVIRVWQQLDVTRDSATWKHVGIGVAHLRLDNLDQAAEQLSKAVEIDPTNAVAEYFLGRVCQAKSRKVPFWYEKDDSAPFRLIVLRNTESVGDVREGLEQRGAILPQYKSLPFDKQAKQHFRRAIRLSNDCPLDREIEIIEPQVRLIAQSSVTSRVTIRDLLISLDEEDYVQKSRDEVQERFVASTGGVSLVLIVPRCGDRPTFS